MFNMHNTVGNKPRPFYPANIPWTIISFELSDLLFKHVNPTLFYSASSAVLLSEQVLVQNILYIASGDTFSIVAEK
jgi:hypothetical protein